MYHRVKGCVCYIQRENEKALHHFLKTYDINSGILKADAQISASIGSVYMLLGNPHRAIQHLERTLTEAGIERIQHLRARILSCLTQCYRYTGEYTKAKKVGEEAHTHYKSICDDLFTGKALSQIGHVHRYSGDFEEALNYYNQALVYSKDAYFDYVGTLLRKAICLRKTKKNALAKEALDECLAVANANKISTMDIDVQYHLMTISNAESADFIQKEAIPFFINYSGQGKFTALNICRELEAHYKAKGATKKVLEVSAIIRDIYETIIYSGS